MSNMFDILIVWSSPQWLKVQIFNAAFNAASKGSTQSQQRNKGLL